MPHGLKRFQQSQQSHFVTFSCFRRRPNLAHPAACDLFLLCLENMRRRFGLCIYGYVVMPKHVHLLVSEPARLRLADALHFLKLSFSKRLHGRDASGAFWQKRYYDRNIRDGREFQEKLRYLHRNPVKRGLVKEAGEWRWSSYRHYALREMGVVKLESEWTARDREVNHGSMSPRIFLLPG